MKHLKIIAPIFLWMLFFAVSVCAQQLGGNTHTFDKAKFQASVKKSLDNKVMGYQVVLLKNGQIVTEMAFGRARNAADGETPMTLQTPSNIGSTSKFVASVALLHLFENRKERTVDSWLDTKIHFYFPKVWQDNMHASIKQITFRNLIEHKTGFIHNDPDCYSKMYPCLVKGVDTSKIGVKRSYANANIQALAYLIPTVQNLSNLTELNNLVNTKKLAGDNQQIHDFLAIRYENFVRTRLFAQMSPTINPSCHAPEEYPAQGIIYAKGYPSSTWIGKGLEHSASGQGCHSQGGWYYTGRELAAFVAHFAATTKFVSAATREKMFDDDDPNNQLGWSKSISDQFLKDKLNWNASPYSGGTHQNAYATILLLPNNYYAIGLLNSDIAAADPGDADGGSRELTIALLEAYKAGIAGNF